MFNKLFEKFVYSHKDKIYGYIFRMCGNRESADDLFQETLFKIWNNFPAKPETAKLRSWCFTIAHNTIVDHLKSKKATTEYDETFAQRNTNSGNPAEVLIGLETSENIEKIVKKLPPKQKRALILRVNGGLKYREIAEVMQEPLNSVLSHINYALKKIRKELEEINAA